MPAPNDGARRYRIETRRWLTWTSGIDIAKALVRISELTIFELPGDQ